MPELKQTFNRVQSSSNKSRLLSCILYFKIEEIDNEKNFDRAVETEVERQARYNRP